MDSAAVCRIDLPDFVAAIAGGDAADQGVLRLPGEWMTGLGDLPGLDREAGALRFTRDQTQLRDEAGNSVAFLGSAHPLVRRAVSFALRESGRPYDVRVSVVRTDDTPLAVLLSYCGELRCGSRVELQRTLGIWLPMRGRPVEICEPERWLGFAEGDDSVGMDGVWQRWFAHWLPRRKKLAEATAIAVMQRIAGQFAVEHGCRVANERRDLCHWLQDRANSVCGAFAPRTGSLFGDMPCDPSWQLLSAPLDRLAGYAGDGNNLPARRREASSVVELFQRRDRENTLRAELSTPTVRQIGMLMLVPSERM